MDIRHQVFISSTFSDLKKERSEVVQALLELDCFPAGMEIFPATTEAAWDLIKGVIDDSDYYCLIIGGRYGSLGEEGIGYTEKEYDYAINTGKPIVAFLHGDLGSIPQDRSEKSEDGRAKLVAFRSKVEARHHCKYWKTAEELGGRVSRSIVSLKKTHPSDGWVPGAYARDNNQVLEMATLKTRIAELEAELANKRVDKFDSFKNNLAAGSDLYEFYSMVGPSGKRERFFLNTTWDNVLSYLGPLLISECSEEELLERIKLCAFHLAREQISPETKFDDVIVPTVIDDEVKIQLRALGYMISGTKRRAVSDRKTYWKLTSAGENRLLTIKAIQKKASPQADMEIIPESKGEKDT